MEGLIRPIPVVPPYSGGPTGLAPRDTLNGVAQKQEAIVSTAGAAYAPIALRYGRVIAGGRIFARLVYQGNLILGVAWGRGPIDAIEQLYIDDAVPPVGIAAFHYLGTQVGPDLTLSTAFSAQTPAVAYTDVLPGIAYSVLQIPPGLTKGWPRISAQLRGLKLYDPRTTLTAWSENPALALAHFITNPLGWNRAVDWASVTEAANYCDEMVGSPAEKRRLISLSIEKPATVNAWIEALRTYAACFVADQGGVVSLIADKPRSPVGFSLDGTNCSLVGLAKRGRMNVPTVMTIVYTDVSKLPVREGRATYQAAGVLAGTTPFRESVVRLEGITRYSQAMREAVERQAKLERRRVNADVRAKDIGLRISNGDVIPVTHPVGLAAMNMLALSYSMDSPGRWIAHMLQYDATVFSDTVFVPPTFDDVSLPNPQNPPPPAGVTLLEEIFQFQGYGQWGSRIKVTITPPVTPWPYTQSYDVEVLDGADAVYSNRIVATSTPVDRTPAIKEGVTYTVNVRLVSSTGARSTPVTASLLALGKTLRPGDVPAITSAFERGGDVSFTWRDVFDIDKVTYEWRRGPVVGFNWDTAAFVGNVDATKVTFTAEPVGSWRYAVKAKDSVGLYSVNAVTADLIVNSDADAFLQDKEVGPYVGAEKVTNGNFAVDANWTKPAGVTIAGGKLNYTGQNTATTQALAGIASNPLLGYVLSITVSTITAGRITLAFNGVVGPWLTMPGTYTFYLPGPAAADNNLSVHTDQATTASIDDVSVKEIGLLNMIPFPPLEGVWKDRWITACFGNSFNASIAGTVNAVATPIIQQHSNGTQRFIGETWDLGSPVSGDWSMTDDITLINGAITRGFLTSNDGTTWTLQLGSTWRGTTRMIRVFIEALTSATFRINAKPIVKLTALARSETFTVQTSASVPTLVEFAGTYAIKQDLQVTPGEDVAGVITARTAVWHRLLLHPERGLMHKFRHLTGDNILYHLMWSGSYVIQAGDYLEYEVYIDSTTPVTTGVSQGGVQLNYSGGFDSDGGGGTTILNDTDGYRIANSAVGFDALARGKWKLRTSVNLPANHIGKTLTSVSITQNGDAANGSVSTILYRNMRIKNGAATVVSIYGTSGEPSANVAGGVSNVDQIKCGPANSVLVNVYNSADGVQVASLAQVAFKGIGGN